MSSLKEEELINILPKDGPTVEEVKKIFRKNIMMNLLSLNVVAVF